MLYDKGLEVYDGTPNFKGIPLWIRDNEDSGKQTRGGRVLRCPECHTQRPTVGLTLRQQGTWKGINCKECKCYVPVKGWTCVCKLWYLCNVHDDPILDSEKGMCYQKKKKKKSNRSSEGSTRSPQQARGKAFRFGRMPGDHERKKPAEQDQQRVQEARQEASKVIAADIKIYAKEIREAHIERAFEESVQDHKRRRLHVADKLATPLVVAGTYPHCSGWHV